MTEPSLFRRHLRPTLAAILALALAAAAGAAALSPNQSRGEGTSSAGAGAARGGVELAEEGDLESDARIARAIADLGESPVATLLANLPAEARKFNDHVITLANPFFEGRAPGTAGNRFAAEYIEYYFRKFGLEPAFATEIKAHDGTVVIDPRSSYRQEFQSGRETRVAEQGASLIIGDARRDLSAGREFTVLGISGNGRVTAPVVFAGYAVVDGPNGYSSFAADADFSGKIAMIMRFEPMDDEGRSLWAERGWSPAAQLEAKIAAVTERNAAGVILVNPPGADDPRANALIDSRTALGGRALGRGGQTPVVMMSQTAADEVFRAAFPGGEVTLLSARRDADEAGMAVDLPNVKVELRARIAREAVMTDNVGAILPGRGALADQFIIIGAHYDHVGYGPAGVMNAANVGKLHAGADDNASGTAGLLILAEKLSEAYAEMDASQSARSVLFLAFSAEELGLIGSRHFVSNPSIDLDKVYLMLNLDMIGRLRERTGLTVEGVESGEGLLEWLQPYFENSDLSIRHGGVVSGNSDHASFYRRNIPVLFFFTGLHPQYHTPSDVGSTINQAGAARVLDLAFDVTLGLTMREETMVFVPRRTARRRGPEAAAPDAEPAQLEPAPAAEPQTPRMAALRVRFGVSPGYGVEGEGVLIDDVSEGGSAHEGGVRPGDRLVAWNGEKITDIVGWMGMMSRHNPGDVVEVTVMRDGREVKLNVKLQGRDGGS